MEVKDLRKKYDKAYVSGQATREKAADDLIFYWITQWDEQSLASVPLQYRGQFDILRKAGRQIMGDLRLNPVQPDFRPKDEARDDDAEIMDGLYRADDRSLSSQEAYDYATQDAVVCGVGAWEQYTEYATNNMGDENQVIKRRWIPEANNCVFWDPAAKRLDKSDAKYCFILERYTEEAYYELVEDLTGDTVTTLPSSFASPEDSNSYQFQNDGAYIFVANCYMRKKVKDKVLTFLDPFGEEIVLRESQLEEVMDELIDSGHEIVSEKVIQRWEVRKYIANGDDMLNGENGEVIAGSNIPVIPVYGERTIINGEEHHEGITRLAKDPQRLRNFQLSYLADIVSRSPRPKPIFNPEQLSGFEFMYDESGAENNYPYLLQNRLGANGEALVTGPVAVMPEQTIPQALMVGIELTRQAVEDVANPGLPQDIADPDLSGKAVSLLQNRMDQQSYIYQHNYKFAKRRDAEIYASIASEISDTPRTVSIEQPDGTTKQVQLMRLVMDKETGEPVVLNDLTNLEFDVYAEIGQTYSSQKEQSRDRLGAMMEALPPGSPERDVMMLTLLEMTDGVNMEHIREFARKRLILGGYKEPETEEEVAMLQAEQENQQEDPNMVLARAEMMKGEAAMLREQRTAQKDALDAQNNSLETQIDGFDAETKRLNVQVNAQKAGADVDYKRADTFNKELDNAQKQMELAAAEFQSRVASMPTSDLLRLLDNV